MTGRPRFMNDPRHRRVVYRRGDDGAATEVAAVAMSDGMADLIVSSLNRGSSLLADAATILDRLPQLLAAERAARGLKLVDVARQVGCASSTIFRTEAGLNCSRDTTVAIMRWLASDGGR